MYYQCFVITPKGAAHDRITVLDPKVESETSAILTLKSKKFENHWGTVLGGEATELMGFIQQLDGMEHLWAALDERQLIEKVRQMAKNFGLSELYLNQPLSQTPDMEGDIAGPGGVPHNKMKRTGFGPLSPAYSKFDTLLREVQDELIARTGIVVEAELPTIGKHKYPNNIHANAKVVWRYAIENFRKQINSYNGNEDRWACAIIIFQKICQRYGVPAFEVTFDGSSGTVTSDQSQIEKKANEGYTKAKSLLELIQNKFISEDLVASEKFDKEYLYKTGKDSNKNIYFISLAQKAKLSRAKALSNSCRKEIGRLLRDVYLFKKTDSDRYANKVDGITDAQVFIEKSCLISIVTIYLTYNQACTVVECPGAESKAVLRSLKKVAQNWLKSDSLSP